MAPHYEGQQGNMVLSKEMSNMEPEIQGQGKDMKQDRGQGQVFVAICIYL